MLRGLDPASEGLRGGGGFADLAGSTNPLLTEQGRANVFRVIGRDDAQGIVAGNYLADHWGDKKIAILHDNSTYGKGLADETRKQLNKRGVTEAIYQAYIPGKNDYSAEIAALQAADIAVLYVGGYHTEVALMARAARDRGYSVQFVSGDAMATEEFGLIAGPAAEGTLFTFVADPRRNPEAAAVVERFRAENFEPAGYTLPATPPSRSGRRRSRRQVRWSSRRSSRHCADRNSTPSWARSISTTRATSRPKAGYGTSGEVESTCRLNRGPPIAGVPLETI